jgi:tRNA threonylcarbamoyladenosine biosynthesis protein TsaB
VSIILNIDTAVEISSICIAENEVPIGVKINPSQKESAAWLHTAIKELIDEKNISLRQLNAIAVTEGPGSYTGLRVGMSTAKGLCYVLNKPLITVNTLKLMAFVARKAHGELLCPMIDARRMEVFAAVLDKELNFVLAPTNLILNESSFIEWLSKESIVFFGNGSVKFQGIMKHPNALFASIEANATSMVSLSYEKFLLREFADLAYAQPFYGKDFHSSIKQSL